MEKELFIALIKNFWYTTLRVQRGLKTILNCQTNSLFYHKPFNFQRVLGASQSPPRNLLTIKIENSTVALLGGLSDKFFKTNVLNAGINTRPENE